MNTKRYRIGIIALLTGAAFINAVDRGAIAIGAPVIMKELSIDPAMMGVILSAFFWPYVLLNIPVSSFADKVGAKTVLGWAAAVWSLASAATGFAYNGVAVVLARIGVGAGEAAMFPVSAKVVQENFPSNERGSAISMYLSGVRLGLAATPVLMAFLMTTLGWRNAFFITGIGSLIWCIFWYILYKQPQEARAVVAKKKIPWKLLLTNRAVLGFILAKFFQDYLGYFFMTWIPAYLVMERGFSIIKMGFYASLPWIAGFIMQNVTGWLSDYMIKRGVDITPARKNLMIGSHLLGAVILGVGFVDDPMIAIALLTISMAGEASAGSLIWVLLEEVAPPEFSGTVGGIMNSIGAIAGILSPAITGILVSMTGNFQLSLLIGGGMVLFAALTVLFIIPDLKPISLEDGSV